MDYISVLELSIFIKEKLMYSPKVHNLSTHPHKCTLSTDSIAKLSFSLSINTYINTSILLRMYLNFSKYTLILSISLYHSIGEGEGMGTTFSISLPMQRIPQIVLDRIENNPAFVRYTNPAVSRRKSHDILRSSQKEISQKNELAKSAKNELSIRRDSTDNLIGTNSNLLLQSGPRLNDAGGGPLYQGVDMSGRPTTERSIKSFHQSSNGLKASSRSIGTCGRTIVDDGGEKYNILVVDDSPLNRKMLSKLLKSKGHVIEEAADGQKGVDIVTQATDAGRHFDVILMDFVMPVMDGPTATRAIRAMKIKTPIFGLTGGLLRTYMTYRLNTLLL